MAKMAEENIMVEKKKEIPTMYLDLLFKKWNEDGDEKEVPTDIILLIAKYVGKKDLCKFYWVSRR